MTQQERDRVQADARRAAEAWRAGRTETSRPLLDAIDAAIDAVERDASEKEIVRLCERAGDLASGVGIVSFLIDFAPQTGLYESTRDFLLLARREAESAATKGEHA